MDNLIQQLKKIEIKPRTGWQKKTRNFLLAKISQDRYAEISFEDFSLAARIFEPFKFMRLAWKPVGIFALAAMFVIGSSGWVVVAAEDAVPGQNLFVVKRTIEKIKNYMITDTVRQTELASAILDRRVNDLEKAIYLETKLVASGEKSEQKTVVAAVAEIKKQLDEVDNKLAQMQGETREKNREAVTAALDLNQKINGYHRELKEVKDKLVDKTVEGELNKAIERAEDINSNVLAVIVENHEKGETTMTNEDLALRLGEHVKQLEEKAAEVAAVILPIKNEQKEMAEKSSEVKEDLAKAREAILKDEYALVLTLARSTNETLKMLFGEIYQIYTDKNTDKTQMNTDKNTDTTDGLSGDGEVKGESTTTVEKIIKPVASIVPETVVEEVKEFEVGI